jgi:hypothetical protein
MVSLARILYTTGTPGYKSIVSLMAFRWPVCEKDCKPRNISREIPKNFVIINPVFLMVCPP